MARTYKHKTKKTGGLIDRLIMGKEKSEGFARASLPSNRWELFWDIFKGRFWKLVWTNLLIVLFLLPLVALIAFREVTLLSYGLQYPFSQGFGVGYQAPTSMLGYAESVILNANLFCYLLLPVAAFFGALGLSGGAYVIRNMVWTEGVFVASDFWRGIKKNFKQALFICILYSLIFYIYSVVMALINQNIATNTSPEWLFVVLKVLLILFIAFFSVMSVHMLVISVTYDVGLGRLIKNGFLFTVGLFPFNVFFAAVSLIPMFIMMMGGIGVFIGIVLLLAFGISTILLAWTDFDNWVFDRYVNDRIGAKKNRGIYEKVKEESQSAALKQYSRQKAIQNKSALASKPIKPITDEELTLAELPTSFRRSDIEKLNASRKELYDDNERYIKEHMAEFETQQNVQPDKEELERQRRIERAKRELNKRKKR